MTRILRALAPVVMTVWWAPTILVGLVLVVAFHINTRRLVRRARRPRLSGRLDEARVVLDRVLSRIPCDHGPGRSRDG